VEADGANHGGDLVVVVAVAEGPSDDEEGEGNDLEEGNGLEEEVLNMR
jgi:hypothetical protein